jgi:hypothetical protein
MKPAFLTPLIANNNSVNPRFRGPLARFNFSAMPTKKQPSRTEREIANKKNHPIAKSNRPAIAQNAEPQPPRRKDQNNS